MALVAPRGTAGLPQRPCALSGHTLTRPVRRGQHVRVAAVLKQDPPSHQAGADDGPGSEAAKLERARKALMEALLGPSLCDSKESSPAPPGHVETAQPGSGRVYFFAYGASMCFATLARQGVRPLSRDAAMVVDPSVRMRFRHRGGYATLEAMPSVSSSPSSSRAGSPSSSSPNGGGSPSGTTTRAVSPSDAAAAGPRPKYPPFDPRVHGVLYQIRQEDLSALAKREAGYVLKDFEVETYDGRHVIAHAFVSSPLALLPGEVTPPEKYMRALREGAGDNFLDPLHQAWLSSVETVSSAGLGAEYFQTPLHYVALGFLGVSALLVVGYFAQHWQ